MMGLVRISTGKAIQWRGSGHSLNRRTLKIETLLFSSPSRKSALLGDGPNTVSESTGFSLTELSEFQKCPQYCREFHDRLWEALSGTTSEKRGVPSRTGGGENSGNALEASNALNCRAWGIPAVLSREIPGNALRVFFWGSFRIFSGISSRKSQPYWGVWPRDFWGSLSSGLRAQWVHLSLSFVCESELTEFFAELTEFAIKLSEAQWVLFSETVLSKQYSASVSYDPPFVAFSDFLALLFLRFSLLFVGVLAFFPSIFGVTLPEKQGKSQKKSKEIQKSKERWIGVRCPKR